MTTDAGRNEEAADGLDDMVRRVEDAAQRIEDAAERIEGATRGLGLYGDPRLANVPRPPDDDDQAGPERDHDQEMPERDADRRDVS